MLKNFCFFMCCLFVPFYAMATSSKDCLEYKVTPDVVIGNLGWSKNIIQPDDDLPLAHGVTEATLTHQNSISVETVKKGDGYCVILNGVKSDFWYDFLVKIDKHHLRGSCTYNAVLEHEQLHINAYLSVFDEFKKNEKSAIKNAADSIMPVFINDIAKAKDIMTDFNNAISQHADVVLADKKMQTANDVKNKKIDTDSVGDTLKKCIEK